MFKHRTRNYTGRRITPIGLGLGSGVFSPLRLGTALQFWYDAYDPATLYQDSALTTLAAADGDPVGGWKDKSGNGRHVTQATGAARPTLKLSIQAGKPVLRADGIDDLLKASTQCTFQQLFFVAKYSGATFAGFDGLFSEQLIAETYCLLGDDTTDHWFARGGTYWKNGVQLSGNSAAGSGPMNAFHAMSFLELAAIASYDQQFFSDRDFAGRLWLGDLAEAFGLNRTATTSERNAAFGYLKAKWGTP